MTDDLLQLNLLRSAAPEVSVGNFAATLRANGLYNTFQFVLRLSPEVHRKLGESPTGIISSQVLGFDRAQAFSTFLHETVHWWQHIGTTYGLMLSLSYPTQVHGNYKHLNNLLSMVGFKKSIRELANSLQPSGDSTTSGGLANTIVNNHFDLGAFRALTYNGAARRLTTEDPYFENIGHAYQIAYANSVLLLATVSDTQFKVLQHPRQWEKPFEQLRSARATGHYWGSSVELWPIGALEIMEGQACFIQLQYLAFGSGGNLNWDEFRRIGMLHGVYERAFSEFLRLAELQWPATIDDPVVALFLLICDMALNPGSGFPMPLQHFASFITDVDPGARFAMLSRLVHLKCNETTAAIRHYSRDEYVEVSECLARALVEESPLAIARMCAGWCEPERPMASLMGEYATFDYDAVNQPIRLLLSHFLAFMQDKYRTPEFFCWPGAWMTGKRASNAALSLFDKHGALFVDKADNDGIFPRLQSGRDQALVQKAFGMFYGANVVYDMTHQWITRRGPFTYDYHWLLSSGGKEQMKRFGDEHFERAYGVHPDAVSPT